MLVETAARMKRALRILIFAATLTSFIQACANDVGDIDKSLLPHRIAIKSGDDNWTWPKPCQSLVEEANARGGATMTADLYEGDPPFLANLTTMAKTRDPPHL